MSTATTLDAEHTTTKLSSAGTSFISKFRPLFELSPEISPSFPSLRLGSSKHFADAGEIGCAQGWCTSTLERKCCRRSWGSERCDVR
eukprot:2261521-Rhodomonas_salina.3